MIIIPQVGIELPGRDSVSEWHYSEIRLIGARDVGVLVVIIFMKVFGADDLPPFVRVEHVGHGRGPGRREHPPVLHREMNLQILARIVVVDRALLLVFFKPRSNASFADSRSSRE